MKPPLNPSLYVGCSLTQAPTEFITKVESTRQTLKTQYNVLDFVGLVNGTNEDVYRWDIENCVANCTMMLAICDYPSIGLGWELCEATRLEKPVLAVAHEETKITRLLLGAAAIKPNVEFLTYSNMEQDIPKLVAPRFEIAISA